jgi:hypothetical protein
VNREPRYQPCPVCGATGRLYIRRLGWLEIICRDCAEVLHGIEVEVLDGEADDGSAA